MMWKGYLAVLCSAILYGIEPTVREYALSAGVQVAVSMVASSLVMVLSFSAVCAARKWNIRLPLRQIAPLAVLGVLMAMTSTLLGMSYRYIPVGCATVIHFMYPTLVCLVSAVFFGERLTRARLTAMVLSIMGLICITGGVHGSAAGVVLALCSSLTYVGYILLLDHAPQQKELPPEVRMLYVSLFCMATSALLLGGRPSPGAVNAQTAVSLLVCGLIGAAAIFLFAFGVQRAGAARASFFSLFEPMTSMVVSTLVYRYAFTPIMLLGCALSLGAVLSVSLGAENAARSRGTNLGNDGRDE